MDTLDKLIELAQITGSVDIQCLFRDKWYAPHERRRAHGIAHLVVAGESYIKIEGEPEARRLKGVFSEDKEKIYFYSGIDPANTFGL